MSVGKIIGLVLGALFVTVGALGLLFYGINPTFITVSTEMAYCCLAWFMAGVVLLVIEIKYVRL